jgi:hypothetical protein
VYRGLVRFDGRLDEPGEDFVEGGTDTHDVATMELQSTSVTGLRADNCSQGHGYRTGG